ncbi:MAG: hypothetical protein HY898_21010 [Deltaproteobacteria bacterium]|nr:hypothetical protein [Deltaproteobacteria bacterium]
MRWLPLIPILLAGAWTCGGKVTVDADTSPWGAGGADAAPDSVAKGGTSTGGTTTGGSTTGGSAGAVDDPFVQCSEADPSVCKLFNDCCSCTAYGPDEPATPKCPPTCSKNACMALGLPSGHKLECKVGRCIVGFDCNPTHATCNEPPPDCGPWAIAPVINGCWGGCVQAADCVNVPQCEACDKSDLCVNHFSSNDDLHCVPVPNECAGDLTSKCFCPLVCPNWGFCKVVGPNTVQCEKT